MTKCPYNREESTCLLKPCASCPVPSLSGRLKDVFAVLTPPQTPLTTFGVSVERKTVCKHVADNGETGIVDDSLFTPQMHKAFSSGQGVLLTVNGTPFSVVQFDGNNYSEILVSGIAKQFAHTQTFVAAVIDEIVKTISHETDLKVEIGCIILLGTEKISTVIVAGSSNTKALALRKPLSVFGTELLTLLQTHTFGSPDDKPPKKSELH